LRQAEPIGQRAELAEAHDALALDKAGGVAEMTRRDE